MTTIEARMKKAADKKNNRKVYRFKNFSTPHILFVPLMVLCWLWDAAKDAIKSKIRSLIGWNTKRADRIITNEIVQHGECENGELSYYFHNHWTCRWWGSKYHCRWYDRAFCRKFNDKITDYAVEEFQIAGYTKNVERDEDGWYHLIFEKKG